MTDRENIIENIVDMFFAQKTLYQKMTGEYVDKRTAVKKNTKQEEHIEN